MKKILAVLSAALLFAASAFAEGYISANDITKGTIIDNDLACEDGFVIHGDAEKFVVVDGGEAVSYGDETFTQRINLKGAGKAAGVRSVTFPAKKGEKVTVYTHSSSKTEARTLVIANEAGEQVAAIAGNVSTDPVSVETITIPADGTYSAFSKKSGMYIYQIIIAK